MTIVIVGAGPAGLACARELRRLDEPDVVVLDRERRGGGVPRHCEHQGFGLRDLHRVMSGPRYAERRLEMAKRAGAQVIAESMVTGWSEDGALEVTSPRGRFAAQPEAVVLATGCRERPRSARLVPGSRPEGVMTTGTLQQLVQRHGPGVGERALVVGAEHVSFSALRTLRHARAKVVGMTTELPRHQTLRAFRAGAAVRYRAPLWTRTAVAAIHGGRRVEEVELLDLDSGETRRVDCDTVVFTADWIPDGELAALGGLEMDPATRGPRVDTGLRTSRPGVFAAGNLVHPAEPADVAALAGRHAANRVARWLRVQVPWPSERVPIECEPPLRWTAPGAVSREKDAPPRGHFALRSSELLGRTRIEIRQGERTLWSGRVRRLVPGRSTRIPAGWIESVDSAGAPIRVIRA